MDRAHSADADSDDEDFFPKAEDSGTLATELLRREREIEWVAEVFRDGIREIVAQRESRRGKTGKTTKSRSYAVSSPRSRRNRIPLDEVVDVIKMPAFDKKVADANASAVKIPEHVSCLVREYVSVVSMMVP